ALRGDRGERANHARHGAEQAEQRRNGRDRAERPEITLELVHDVPAAVLDALLDHLARRMPVREARREHLTERRALRDARDLPRVELILPHELPNLGREIRRDHALALQRPEALEEDCDSHDRAHDDRHHEPAAGFDDFKHRIWWALPELPEL